MPSRRFGIALAARARRAKAFSSHAASSCEFPGTPASPREMGALTADGMIHDRCRHGFDVMRDDAQPPRHATIPPPRRRKSKGWSPKRIGRRASARPIAPRWRDTRRDFTGPHAADAIARADAKRKQRAASWLTLFAAHSRRRRATNFRVCNFKHAAEYDDAHGR